MRRQRFFLSLVMPLLLAAVIGAASIPKGSIPTKGTFFNSDISVAPTLRITGDTSDLNTVYEHNVDGVISFLSPKYDLDPLTLARGFQINLNFTNPQRNLRFDFADRIGGLDPLPPEGKFQEGTFVVGSLPEDACEAGCFTTAMFITPGPEGIRLRFNPDPQYGGNLVLATRISGNTWDVRTQLGADVAHLSIQTKATKGQTTEKSIGTFHMPFHMTIVPK